MAKRQTEYVLRCQTPKTRRTTCERRRRRRSTDQAFWRLQTGFDTAHLLLYCRPTVPIVKFVAFYPTWQLRSANSGALVVPRRSTTIGRRDFALAGRPHGTASSSTWGLHQCPEIHLRKNSKPIYL